MPVIYIILLVTGAALVCSMLRMHRPEIATMVSLAVGLSVFMLAEDAFSGIATGMKQFIDLTNVQNSQTRVILKAAGLAILGELGVEICSDAGESALAGRIRFICRIAMLSMAMPYVTQIVDIAASYGG